MDYSPSSIHHYLLIGSFLDKCYPYTFCLLCSNVRALRHILNLHFTTYAIVKELGCDYAIFGFIGITVRPRRLPLLHFYYSSSRFSVICYNFICCRSLLSFALHYQYSIPRFSVICFNLLYKAFRELPFPSFTLSV